MERPTLDGPDGFAARLRYVVNSYGSANALAGAIQRSEGAIRKWLRGKSEPTVSDLRAICETTKTNIEWLVTGRGDPKGFGIRSPAPCSEECVPRRVRYRRVACIADLMQRVTSDDCIDRLRAPEKCVVPETH